MKKKILIIVALMFSIISYSQKKPTKTIQQQANEYKIWFEKLNVYQKRDAARNLVLKLNNMPPEYKGIWLAVLADKKTVSAPAKVTAPVLKSLESLSEIQIANALYVEIGLDGYEGAQNNILKSYMKSSAKVVNIAEIIYDSNIYYLVDRFNNVVDDNDDDILTGNNRESYEDNGSTRSTVAINPHYGDKGSGSNPWISRLNQEEVNKFRVSSRDKIPIELVGSNISVMCQKAGDTLVEALQIGNDMVSQYFIKGTHSYIISVDRSGKVSGIKSKDLIVNNHISDNYNICSERLIAKIENFKFKDDLDAPTFRTYAITINATVKSVASNVPKFVHDNNTYLSDFDPSRKFYTDSIRITSRMNDAMKELKQVESIRDSIGKGLVKNREDILEKFKTNFAAHIEKDRQRLLKEEWGGKLDPRTTSYDSTLEMIQRQAQVNTNEIFSNLESSSKRDVIHGMESINEEYDRVVNIYNNLQSEYESLKY
ncbi:hypothetical protein ACM55K_13960 [Flavobacterium sp. LT1R49]|uniref:hypothetical protein n=1 Tax=Flavobacterium arabinosi TaxID=3398737 RepID=UPI003A85BDDD